MRNEKLCKKMQMEDIGIYTNMQNYYKRLFEEYILSKVDLKKYDDELINSNLDFGECIEKPKLFSGLNEYLNLNHIYILNLFFVEKLSINTLNILSSGSDEEKKSIIEHTYKEVLKNNYYGGKYDNRVYKISYGMRPSLHNLVSNNALVIGIYYGKNKNDYNKNSYLQNYEQKKKFLNDFSNRIKIEVSQKLGIPVEIICNKTF